MALNTQTLKTRSLTAVVFAAVMLTGLLWNFWSFLILFTIIHCGCWYEFIKLVKKINRQKYLYYLPLGLLYITLPCFAMIVMGVATGQPHLQGISNVHYTLLYPSSIIYLPLIPCAIIFSIWINDTMAYIVGSLIGKTPFSKISPNKTWEGTTGGALLCVGVITLLGNCISIAKAVAVQHWIAIAVICAVLGTLGDLLESKLKRMANVKDSGALMPGHGGFLDRFDSLLVATPFVWLYLYLFI